MFDIYMIVLFCFHWLRFLYILALLKAEGKLVLFLSPISRNQQQIIIRARIYFHKFNIYSSSFPSYFITVSNSFLTLSSLFLMISSGFLSISRHSYIDWYLSDCPFSLSAIFYMSGSNSFYFLLFSGNFTCLGSFKALSYFPKNRSQNST